MLITREESNKQILQHYLLTFKLTHYNYKYLP